ncbi:MAG: TonB-dependent receptor [Bacteroidota bacterium]|nr:TonB-dependent receptor [Bacteroidota bacterium]
MFCIMGICLIVLAASSLAAQQHIEGIVYGEEPDGTRRPLPGARVQWVRSEIGVLTHSDGHFRLPRPDGVDTLRVGSVGYRSRDTVLPAGVTGPLVIVLRADYEVGEVTVEAAAPTIAPAPVKTELISIRQLEQSACCTLAESFEKSPTVEATFSDPLTGLRQIQMLGLSGAYVQTLVEAVPLFRGLSLPFLWEYIPGPFLQGIAISKGATSVVDGYEGLTGTICVDYRKPFDSPPLFANLFASSAGRLELNLASARVLSRSWQGMGFLNGRWSGWEQDANRDGFVDMPLVRQLGGTVWLLHPEEPELQVLAKAVVDERHGGTLRTAAPEQKYLLHILGRRGELVGKSTQRLSDITQFGVRAALAGQRLQATLGRYPYEGTQFMGTFATLFVSEWEDGTRLRYGANLLVDSYDERFADTAWKRRELVPGAFLEATLYPRSGLTVVAGLRADWHSQYGAFLTPWAYLRWQPWTGVTMRLSGGRGMRVPNIVADNLPAFLSSRQVTFGPLSPEWGWNYGGSLTLLLPVGGLWTLDLEAYRTEFRNQVVPDLDWSPHRLLLQNAGRAYANSLLLQAEGMVAGVELRLAYRWWDAWAQTGGQWRRRPLVSPHRVLATVSYATPGHRWQVDATLAWNSGGRLPTAAGNPDSLRWGERFPAIFRCQWGR